jgi:nitrogen fixation NifU-like protein
MAKEKRENGIAQMLSESGYSDKAIHYFQTRENIGIMEDADQVSDLTGPCGDTMKISLHIERDRIDDAKIQVLGCPGAVASGCALINLAKGKTLEEAGEIDVDHLYKELERLPDQKLHCARLAVKTLQKALEEYKEKCRKAAN